VREGKNPLLRQSSGGDILGRVLELLRIRVERGLFTVFLKIRAIGTLALSNIILKPFHTSILRSPEWALSSLPAAISNTQTARLDLFKKFTGPFRGLIF